MTTAAVRSMIREVLAEELKRIGRERAGAGRKVTTQPTKEVVTVNSDEELQALVKHILEISRDKTTRDKLVKGEHIFVLGTAPDRPVCTQTSKTIQEPSREQSGVVQIRDGFLSERRVETLPEGTRVVQLGLGVRFTPLARDRLRQRKIVVERMR